MTTQRCLVPFASNHGQTARVASRIAERLRERGVAADAVDVTSSPDPAGATMVVVGGSIHAGRHQRALVRWMRRNAAVLNGRPTAVFSVSLAAHVDPDGARRYVDQLLRRTGVRAGSTAVFAGALRYPAYGWPTRWVMRRIARSQGLSTDTSCDVELTDWAAVDAFADGLPVAGSGGDGEQ